MNQNQIQSKPAAAEQESGKGDCARKTAKRLWQFDPTNAQVEAGWLPFNTAPTHGGSFLAVYMIGEKIKSYHMAHWDFDLEKFTYHPGAVRKPTHWHPIPIFEPNLLKDCGSEE